MWKISRESFGFVLTFSGRPDVLELTDWVAESKRRLSLVLPPQWGLIVDMRDMEPLDPDAQLVMREGQKKYKQRGMKRVAVVINDPITIMQFRRIGRSTGVDAVERFINATKTQNWQATARRWVVDGVKPPRIPRRDLPA